MDAHKNFAYSTIAAAPSPATSGLSLTVAAGEGARFPAAPFNAVVWPAGALPLSPTAEIVRVTARASDVFTITRAEESSTARTIVVGDQIAAAITAKTLTDIEGAIVVDSDATITVTDITTNNVSITKHGFAPKAPNDATKFLDGTGSYSVPAGGGGGGGGGGLVLLEQHTASGSASIDFTASITSLYDEYLIELINLLPASAGANLLFRVSTDAGATYAASTDYYGALAVCSNSAAVAVAQTNAATAMHIFDAVDNTLASGGVSGSLRLFNPLSATIRKTLGIALVAARAADASTAQGMALWNLTTAVDAFRFFFSSGNIASGTIRVYGVEK